MIELYFKSKRSTSKWLPNVSAPRRPISVIPSAFEEAKAARMKCTPEEYRHRVTIVSHEQGKFTHQNGDTIYPAKYDEYLKYGKMIIVGVCRHYQDYGTVEWNDPPFIVAVSPLNDRQQVVNCSIGWVQKTEPENPYLAESLGAC
jgi:hypothetical protein